MRSWWKLIPIHKKVFKLRAENVVKNEFFLIQISLLTFSFYKISNRFIFEEND